MKNYFTALLLCILIQSVKGQNQNPYAVPNILPPSPNAAALGKYGGIQPGLASGAVNVSIPIYEYSSRLLKLPISIDYNSTGLKVDEIASRVGQGWVLNAGGVITRTVYGSVDDSFIIRMMPPLNYTMGGWTDLQRLSFLDQMVGGEQVLQGGVGPYGQVDGQPDMFSFNFNNYSGKFILDTLRNQSNGSLHYGQPLLLSHSGLKILKDSNGADFRAITTEGIQYVFNSNAREYTETSTPGSSTCNTHYGIPVITAWYLSKIIHPNKDTINFTYRNITTNYTTNISQTIYAAGQRRSSSTDCLSEPTIIPNTSCENILTTNGVYLDEISSTSGGKVKFNYTSRTDYNDQLVSSITVYAPGQVSPLKTVVLEYTYAGNRPFLKSCSERDATLTKSKKHSFGYKDLSEVPQRLSYAQDHWGYYNGQSNNTLIPVPTSADFKQNLPLATANRAPYPAYAMKGVLSSIAYPTGGKDSIQYEGNLTYQMVAEGPVSKTVSANTNGTTWPAPTYSSTATLAFEQSVNISAYCNSDRTEDEDSKMTQFTIRNSANTVVYNKVIGYNQTVNENIFLYQGTYTIEVSVYGYNITGGGSMTFLEGGYEAVYKNVVTGGLRVAKVLTYENMTAAPQVKKYSYTSLSDPGKSSGGPASMPFYERLLRTYYICPSDCGRLETDYYTMYSSSLNNIYEYTSGATSYADVTEGFGDNDENGKIEHTFTVRTDDTGYAYIGDYTVGGTPLISNSTTNGREVYQGIYRKEGNGFVPLKKVYTHYNMNPDVNGTPFHKRTWAGVANRKYSILTQCSTVLIPQDLIDMKMATYDLMVYGVNHDWVYVDSVLTRTYDAKGQSYVDEVTRTKYSNPGHALPTSVINYNSNKEELKTVYTYPSDYPSTAPYPDMVSRHISPVIEQVDYKANVFVKATQTNYHNPFAEIYAPETVQSKSGVITNPYDTRLRFHTYDNLGNVICVSQEEGSKTCYVWGYSGRYPVAKIENTDYNTVLASLGGQSLVNNFGNNVNPTDAMVKSFLTPLRSIPNAMVSVYTYNPLTGVTSSTDPKGMTVYYEYDEFQRLKNVKDQDGNIIKNTTYHYKP